MNFDINKFTSASGHRAFSSFSAFVAGSKKEVYSLFLWMRLPSFWDKILMFFLSFASPYYKLALTVSDGWALVVVLQHKNLIKLKLCRKSKMYVKGNALPINMIKWQTQIPFPKVVLVNMKICFRLPSRKLIKNGHFGNYYPKLGFKKQM